MAVLRLSLVVTNGGYSLVAGSRLLLAVAASVVVHRLWGAQASGVVCTGLCAPQHVESSWTRDRSCVPGTGRWTLNR